MNFPFANPDANTHPSAAGIDDGARFEREGWNAETLQSLLQASFHGAEVMVVSNREPYMHSATPLGIKAQRPVSGLVTALEAVVSTCSGTWIAHGSGSADEQCCDANGRLGVPADNPRYTLRRIWLSKQEEKGYYQGFSNEGLWPLCHMAHVRPRFGDEDWKAYRLVNSRFADAVIEEAASRNPIVLVQDYHLALVPAMIRKRLPDAIILTFWHIPWPAPDVFAICPWRTKIIDGLLGSTTIGFQTEAYRDNFLGTVKKLARHEVNLVEAAVETGERTCHVKHYPISVSWPKKRDTSENFSQECRKRVRDECGLAQNHVLLLGVDRMDYTKGIEEKFLALELLLERYPEYLGRLSLLQVAAPTRCDLEAYQVFGARVRALALRINARFSRPRYKPILLELESCDAETVDRYYRACDICVVTSLHDGMNLVAKEFVAARSDEQGVLVLSEFAGAADELADALIINPYHLEQVADAMALALAMSPIKQSLHMRRMRLLVKEANVYRWAGRMLNDGLRHQCDSKNQDGGLAGPLEHTHSIPRHT